MFGDGLSFASDTIQCQLEYESMDTIQEINKKKESADAAQSIILHLMFQGMPEAVSPNDPNMPRIAEILKREMKKKIAASNDLDAVTQYTIDPCKMDLLQKTYERSQQTMKRWLFPELNLLRQVTSFESWLKSWIWSPLSGDKTYVKSSRGGYFALSYVWADQHQQFHYDNQIESALNLGKAGGLALEQLVDESGMSSAPTWLLEGIGLNTSHPRKSKIILDGRPTEIGENLEKALRTLREIPEVQNGTRIWVDSLCIDQANCEEKNVEVKRMGDISKSAERVISWLGEEEEEHCGDALEDMAA
jgi:hypothetical protein